MSAHSPPPLRTDRRGVSPVIGVVMMVAITVILTGIIAAFVLGFGADAAAPPQASLALETNDSDELVVHHEAGDAVDLTTVYVRGDFTIDESVATVLDDGPDRLRTGESITIDLGGDEPASGDTLALVWDVGDEAATLAELRWPATA